MWGAGWGRGGSSSDQSEAYPKQHPTACGSMALRTRGEDGQSNPARNKQRRLSAGGGRSNKKTRSAQLSRRQERRTVLEGCCCGRVCPWAPGGHADSKAAGSSKHVRACQRLTARSCPRLDEVLAAQHGSVAAYLPQVRVELEQQRRGAYVRLRLERETANKPCLWGPLARAGSVPEVTGSA